MALLIRGKTTCHLCKKTILPEEDVSLFPPFVRDSSDPLAKFNDAACHMKCVLQDPLGASALDRAEKLMDACQPANRRCSICGKVVTHPDDYILIEHLTEEVRYPAYRLNFRHFHKSCLRGSEVASEVIRSLRSLRTEQGTASAYIDEVIEQFVALAGL